MYVENYRDIYGEAYMTSNVHNLTHLVDDVRRFGILSTMHAYPFENMLYQIKMLLRQGNRPLVQVAKRLSEVNKLLDYEENKKNAKRYPILKNQGYRDIPDEVQMEIAAGGELIELRRSHILNSEGAYFDHTHVIVLLRNSLSLVLIILL